MLLVACGGTTSSGEPGKDGGSPPVDAGLDAPATFDATTSPPDAAVPPLEGPGVLLFAGYGEAPLSDTWSWSGTAWTELTSLSASPSVRNDQSMIGFQGKVLLFGGEGLGSDLADTWEFDGTTWTQRMVTGPSAREGAALAVLNDKVILYGGSDANGGFLSDTWTWDGNTWTQLAVTGPGQRYGHAMATLGTNVVLFGGLSTDTWIFDGTAWTAANAAGPTGVDGGLSDSRIFVTLATLGDKVVLFGGEEDANHLLDDTWTWDGTSWTEVPLTTHPAARFHAGMTTFEGKVVLYGGAGVIPADPFFGDTWTWDGTSWTEVAETGPSARYAYALAVWGNVP